jgi:tetratricopeptide (TPR) repeat protein
MRPRLSSLLPHSALALACALAAQAQSYILQNGAVVPADSVTVRENFLVQGGGGQVERRVPLSDIARLDFPAPPEFAAAETELATGRAPQALALVEPVYRRFFPFAAIPGSPFPAAAALRLRALLAGEDAAATTAASAELVRLNLNPETRGLGLLAKAQLEARAGRAEIAQLMIDEAVKDAPDEVLARAWLIRGDLAARRSAHEEAAEAYLRVQAFYGTVESLVPEALLGAARSLRAHGSQALAERLLGELMDGYPGTPQSAIARKELGF